MQKPNIVYILADDMGYGDVGHLNADCAFPTPNLDRLGQGGMSFTDAHSSSAVCTPSRYSLMTGRYCWRTFMKQGVLHGVSSAMIDPERDTVAKLLQRHGYRTACVGKWHLGWDWAVKEGHEAIRHGVDGTTQDWIDFDAPITDGPTTRGFDHYYGIAASLDMPPYVYVDDDQPIANPLAWGTDLEFVHQGPRLETLRASNVLGDLTAHACTWLAQQRAEQPFLLYFPLTAPHGPIAPSAEFVGKSRVNPYADFCMEVDARIGQIMDQLESQGLSDNTLIIFTADNGASEKQSEASILQKHYNHYPSYHYRGFKSDIWDGGHRMPFIAHWPAHVAANSWCHDSIGLFDLYATVADLVGEAVSDDAGEDSVSFAPALRGEDLSERSLIHHSCFGQFAIRRGKWKLCRCPGSGGWSLRDKHAEQQGLPPIQLYDMSDDCGERTNLAEHQPELVAQLTAELHRIVLNGRSTPGPPQRVSAEELDNWDQVNWQCDLPEAFVFDD